MPHSVLYATSYTNSSSDVIIMELAAGARNKVPYETYIRIFLYSEKWQNDISLQLTYEQP